MPKSTILIVEDEDDIRTLLADQFDLDDEFEVLEAGTATESLRIVSERAVDIVIMDVGLPDMDGRDAVKAMRDGGFQAPVVILSGLASDEDAIKGLEAGAFDYVSKPFRFPLLLARVRSHLRNWQSSPDVVTKIGDFSFSYGTRELVDPEGKRVRLTEKEAGILRHLLRAKTGHVSRETLLQEVWRHTATLATHTLETHIYRLRRKIESNAVTPRFIVTTKNGYRLFPEGSEARSPAQAA